jgi:hypothetical protein
MIRKWYALGLTALMLIVSYDATVKAIAEDYDGIIVHYQGDYETPYIYCWESTPSGTYPAWPGEAMVKDLDSDWYTKEFPGITFINLISSMTTDRRRPET